MYPHNSFKERINPALLPFKLTQAVRETATWGEIDSSFARAAYPVGIQLRGFQR
jgi:hypothetical protein